MPVPSTVPVCWAGTYLHYSGLLTIFSSQYIGKHERMPTGPSARPPRPAVSVSPPPSTSPIPPLTPLISLRKKSFLQLQLLSAPRRPPPHLTRRHNLRRVAPPVGTIPGTSLIAPHVCRRNAIPACSSCHLPENSRRGCFVTLPLFPPPLVAIAPGRRGGASVFATRNAFRSLGGKVMMVGG